MGDELAKPGEDEPIAVDPDALEDIPGSEGAAEVEIVRAGKEGSQPDKQHGIRKRVNKLNAKLAEANDATANTQAELEHEREKNKLLQLALEQKPDASLPPDPVDFDSGVADPRYAEALRTFNQPAIDAAVTKATERLAPAQAAPINPGLESNQRKHYERAAELGAKDFDEVEDVAITALGSEIANHLIQNSSQSHLVLYYLGKHPDEAEAIKELVASNPIKAMLQIGRLEAELSVKPKANVESAPDPDEELQGGTPSAGKTNQFQRKLDKAREAAQESGDMGSILRIKREAKAAGATIL